MSTLLAEPVVHEVEESQFISAAQESPALGPGVIAKVEGKEETHPMLMVFVACVIAFHVAAAMIGSLVAWIYQLRHSGAFAP